MRSYLFEPEGSFRLNLEFFRHHLENVAYTWENGGPIDAYRKPLRTYLGLQGKSGEPLSQSHKNLPGQFRRCTRRHSFTCSNTLYRQHHVDTLALAGGCAMNSVANGKVSRIEPFKHVYIQSAAGDSGGAIGAAFVAWHSHGKPARSFAMDHARYWGPGLRNAISPGLSAKASPSLEYECTVEKIDDEDGALQHDGCTSSRRVVGWFRVAWSGPVRSGIVRLSAIRDAQT